jgi:hypothetical protein
MSVLWVVSEVLAATIITTISKGKDRFKVGKLLPDYTTLPARGRPNFAFRCVCACCNFLSSPQQMVGESRASNQSSGTPVQVDS